MIDRKQISLPNVVFSQKALSQFQLIVENDFTLAGKYLRLVVTGKGCDGFSYGVGFTNLNDDDFLITLNETQNLCVIMDPFTAFYLHDCFVDYQTDFENDQEGFTVTNKSQALYSGKFWKKDQQKLPPQASLNS